jgi:hypothetical protein
MARGKKTGGGSRKGIPNKHKNSFREQLRDYCTSIGVDPHHYMANIIADESTIVYGVDANGEPIVGPAAKPDLKLQAAKELAQYLEPKLKAIEHSGEVDHAVRIIEVTLG